MNPESDKLAVIDTAKRIFEINSAATERFDFGTEKLDAGFKFVFDEIFVISRFVISDISNKFRHQNFPPFSQSII
jgi:hypothetical protein